MNNIHVLLEQDYQTLSLILRRIKNQHIRSPLYKFGLLLKRSIKRKKYRKIKNRSIDLYLISKFYIGKEHFLELANLMMGLSARCFVIGSELEKFDSDESDDYFLKD